MATFTKFNSFVEFLAEKQINLSTGLKVYLSNDAPAAGDTVRKTNGGAQNGPEEIAAGNGYTAGGNAITTSSSSQTGGLYTAVFDNVTFTASGGSIGPFRYAVVYDDGATNDELIGWIDYGASGLTLNNGESLLVDFAASSITLQ